MKHLATSIKAKIESWYQGKYIPPPKNDPSSPLFIVSSGHYKRPLLAKIINPVLKFWFNHWKVLLPVIVAALVPLYIYYDSKSARQDVNETSFQNAGIQNRPKLKIVGRPLIKYIRGTSDTPITIKNINDRKLGLTLSLGTKVRLINEGNSIAKLMFEVVADKYSGVPEIRKFMLSPDKRKDIKFNSVDGFYKVIEIDPKEESDFTLTRTIENPNKGMFTIHYLFIYSNLLIYQAYSQ